MQLLRAREARQLTLGELERQLMNRQNGCTKTRNETHQSEECANELDVRKCTAGPFQWERPKPCRCPTHHKPSVANSTCMRGCAFKFRRNYESEHRPNDSSADEQ